MGTLVTGCLCMNTDKHQNVKYHTFPGAKVTTNKMEHNKKDNFVPQFYLLLLLGFSDLYFGCQLQITTC